MAKNISKSTNALVTQKEDFVKNYDKMIAVRRHMKKELEDIKTNILFSGVKNMNGFTRIHRDLAVEMDDGLDSEAYELEKNKAIDSFLERDGDGRYCDMMKDLNKCLIVLDEKSSWANWDEVDKAISDLQAAAQTYYNGIMSATSGHSQDYVNVRLNAAGNINKITPVFRLENNQIYNSISANGEKLPIGRYRKLIQDYRKKYGMKEIKISNEELREYHRLSEIRVEFANKMARLYPETLMFLGIYSANETVDKYIDNTARTCIPKTNGQKAIWYLAKKEYDRIFADGITTQKAEEICNSFDPEQFEERVKALSQDDVFKDIMKNCGAKAFERWSSIEMETDSIIGKLNFGTKRRNDYANTVYSILNSEDVEDKIGSACECASRYYVDSIISNPKYAAILHAVLVWDRDKDGHVDTRRKKDFEKETRVYIRKSNILEHLEGKPVEEIMAVLDNPGIQDSIMKSYVAKHPLKAPVKKKSGNETKRLPVMSDKGIMTNTDAIIIESKKTEKAVNFQV